jgi:hypothetical protein
MYIENDYDLLQIKRAVKMILQINQILREGHKVDFKVQDVKTIPIVQGERNVEMVDSLPL